MKFINMHDKNENGTWGVEMTAEEVATKVNNNGMFTTRFIITKVDVENNTVYGYTDTKTNY